MGICNAAIGNLPLLFFFFKPNKYYWLLLRLISEKNTDSTIQEVQNYDMYLWIHLETKYLKLTTI